MDENIETIKKTLKKYSQEHLLDEYEKLDGTKQKQLLDQIEHIDFELINSLYSNTKKEVDVQESKISPIEYLDKDKLNGYYKSFQETGEKAIRAEAENRAETEGGKVWKAGSETAVWPERGKGKEER